jgi:septum formation protein
VIWFTSESSRRRELLQQIGFRVIRPENLETEEDADVVQQDAPVDYVYHKHEANLDLDDVKQMSIEAARRKISQAVNEAKCLTTYRRRPEETVVAGADTVVYFKGQVLDRPLPVNPRYVRPGRIEEARDSATQMLRALRGQEFSVLTGLVLAQGDNLRNERSCCVVTEAKMREYSDEDIERYIRTGEPLDKAGGFGIQEKGVILFEKIKGSYSNVVGLPLVEFVDLLRDPLFEGRVQFRLDRADPQAVAPVAEGVPELSVVSVGDINYDLVYNEVPAGFFSKLTPPGEQLQGELYRGPGGTAVIFALRALSAGFQKCSVLGTVGDDALGNTIKEKLKEAGIESLLPAGCGRETSIALVLRDAARHDTSLTITDARQHLSEEDVKEAETRIRQADVVFISGYCLVDHDRREATLKVMDLAKKAGGLVVFDVTVDMEKRFDFATFIGMIGGKLDVLVAQIPTILGWWGEGHKQDDWTFITDQIIPDLRQYFPVLFLRTSSYSHEIIALPDRILGPIDLDYSRRAPQNRLGYADEKTAQNLYRFMSPRLLLASASPRRLDLLRQIVAENKIEVLASDLEEVFREEDPEKRVKRLARDKARQVLSRSDEFSPTIEIVIGADTEIVLGGQVLGHPHNEEEARRILRRLSGQTHQAVTGLALINANSGREIVDCVSTRVRFKTLSDDEIEQYVESGEPIGKAGAYGIQGKGALFVEEIDGSYSNVVGLPLERLSEMLDQECQMPIWDIDKVSHWNAPHQQGDVK